MTDLQLSKIKKPSKLIRIALGDLVKAERSKKYRVDMRKWHKPNGQCAVCFAGSVMAFSLKADRLSHLCDTDFRSRLQLDALDDLRMGRVDEALDGLNPRKRTFEYNRLIVKYKSNPKLFKSQMRKLARDLEKDNL